MQNVQRWSENVMIYDDFDGRMVMGQGISEGEKMMGHKETEMGNCRTAESTNRQDVEGRQLDK